MKKVIYKANERGHANHGWLDAWHYFSFAGYYNPPKENFGMLRVLNDDTISGGAGFGMHPHDNMEIVTIPLQGALEHRDSMGSHGIIKPGEVQVMSAGTGILHSEFNHQKDSETKLFQVWIFPNKKNAEPRYEQKDFSSTDRSGRLVTLVSPDGSDGSLWVNQDAWFSSGKFKTGSNFSYPVKKTGNGIFALLVEGKAVIGGEQLSRRDAIGVYETSILDFQVIEDSELLVIEIPMNP